MAATKRMQEIVMEAITDRLDMDDFLPNVEMEYANTGIIRAIPEGHFSTTRGLRFQFNGDYATFKPAGASAAQSPSWYIEFQKGDAHVTTAMDEIVQYLEGHDA